MDSSAKDLEIIEKMIASLSPQEVKSLLDTPDVKELMGTWKPNPGPQTKAYFCEADELLFGGSAGGGKTDLLVGLAKNEHKKSRILRRINQDAHEVADRFIEINGVDGFTKNPPTFRKGDQMIEFRGCERETDKQRFKGRARDFIGYDELADFSESIYTFINTWNRSTNPNQRCRIVGATNGPTTPEGRWLLKRWAAWLDPKHPNPAKDGELRWYLTIDDNEQEVDGPGPYDVRGKMIRATSRTFIRSRLEDNPDLYETGYGDRLESLPEELRKVYREGDFTVGLKDLDYQVIPTAWVDLAMQRWTPQRPANVPMTCMAVDVAPGGGDKRVIAHRYNGWYGELNTKKEIDKSGHATTAAVVQIRRDNCPVIVDLGGGYGGDAIAVMSHNGMDTHAYLGVSATTAKTKDGKMGFKNRRAEDLWAFREALDPDQDGGSCVALPPDPELRSDLCSYTWFLARQGGIGIIQVESKEEIKARLGRSPDKGDAVVMCLNPGHKIAAGHFEQANRPKVNVGYAKHKRRS